MASNATRVKKCPDTIEGCVTLLMSLKKDFTSSYYDELFVHIRAMNGQTDV